MTNYQRGYAMGEQAISEFGIAHALDTSEHMKEALGRLDMYAIGYSTSVGVAMERVWA